MKSRWMTPSLALIAVFTLLAARALLMGFPGVWDTVVRYLFVRAGLFVVSGLLLAALWRFARQKKGVLLAAAGLAAALVFFSAVSSEVPGLRALAEAQQQLRREGCPSGGVHHLRPGVFVNCDVLPLQAKLASHLDCAWSVDPEGTFVHTCQ